MLFLNLFCFRISRRLFWYRSHAVNIKQLSSVEINIKRCDYCKQLLFTIKFICNVKRSRLIELSICRLVNIFGNQREATAPVHPWWNSKSWFLSSQWKTCLWAELQPWCLSLQWKTCPWAEHSDDDELLLLIFSILKWCGTRIKEPERKTNHPTTS